jgi:hypothetical protein
MAFPGIGNAYADKIIAGGAVQIEVRAEEQEDCSTSYLG